MYFAKTLTFALACIAFTLSTDSVEAGGPVNLSNDNFDSTLKDKNAFVKFYAPWCGHCKKAKPAWDALADSLADEDSVVIGDVDCTVESDLCSRFGVTGYPTIKYFNDDTGPSGDAYNGGRDIAAFSKFVDDNLKPKCTVTNPEKCSQKEKDFIEANKKKSQDDIETQITRLEKMKGESMKPDLKKWVVQRLKILKQMVPPKA